MNHETESTSQSDSMLMWILDAFGIFLGMHFVPVIIMHYIIRSVGTTCGPRVLIRIESDDCGGVED